MLVSGWRIQSGGQASSSRYVSRCRALSPKTARSAGSEWRLQSAVDQRAAMRTLCRRLGRTPVADGWLGLTFSPDGKFVYVGGGSQASVFEFTFDDGKLELTRTFEIVPEKTRTHRDFIGDVAVVAGRTSDLCRGVVSRRGSCDQPAIGARDRKIRHRPTAVSDSFPSRRQELPGSSWADGAVIITTRSGRTARRVRLGQHPTDMIWRARKPEETERNREQWPLRLFVAAVEHEHCLCRRCIREQRHCACSRRSTWQCGHGSRLG